MSQQPGLSRKGSKNSPNSSPKRSSNIRKGYNSPKRAQIEPSKLLYAPRPYARQDSNKTLKSPEFNSVKPQYKTYRKPAVPPKPRNVLVKQRSNSKLKKNSESLNKSNTSVEEINEQNDSGMSGKILKISE